MNAVRPAYSGPFSSSAEREPTDGLDYIAQTSIGWKTTRCRSADAAKRGRRTSARAALWLLASSQVSRSWGA